MQQRKPDWSEWHREYDDPASSLSRRLRIVQEHLRRAIDDRPGRLQIVSICAGEGRDVVGVLANHPRRAEIAVRLVELDPRNLSVARAAVRAASLDGVQVIQADAGAMDNYQNAIPANIVLACGVLGNISDADARRTIEHLPCLCARDAVVIWTRGQEPSRDFALTLRTWFAESGFEEVAFEAPVDWRFRVGVHRLAKDPSPFQPGVQLFRFLR